MSDYVNEEKDETPVEEAPKASLPGVAAPENAQIGDENVAPVREVTVDVNDTPVKAQVMGEPAKAVSEVYVNETSVKLDEVITDPNSPEAVQIPDAGRGSLDLPIHKLSGQTVEQFFADNSE